jgi:hypothetical protein
LLKAVTNPVEMVHGPFQGLREQTLATVGEKKTPKRKFPREMTRSGTKYEEARHWAPKGKKESKQGLIPFQRFDNGPQKIQMTGPGPRGFFN